MTTVLLVIHLMIALAMIGVVLLQRSEGGALGIGGGGGGGGGMGGLMTGRGTANLLSRTTAMLALGFMCTSLLLTILAKQELAPSNTFFDQNPTVQEQPAEEGASSAPSGEGEGSGLDEPVVPVE